MKPARYLIALCVFAFLLRMAFISQAEGLSLDAYETIAQVQHIKETGAPLIASTENGTYIPLPVFPYLLAFVTLFLSEAVTYLVIPNLLAVFAHAAIYYLLLELLGKPSYALLGAFASIFVPAYMTATMLTASSLTLAVPLLLVCITLYLKLRKTKEKRNLLLTAFILLSLTSTIALICLPFLALSLLLGTVRDTKGEPAQQEFAVFALFYLVWLYIILYKSFVGIFGVNIFQENMPTAVLTAAQAITPQLLAIEIGVLVFGLALYAIYKETAGQHIGIQVVIALAFSLVLCIVVRILRLPTGTALFGLVCIVLATIGLHHMIKYAQSLHRKAIRWTVTSTIVILFILTSILPTVAQSIQATHKSAPAGLNEAADWLEENTPKDSVLLADPSWGFFLETRAKRPVYLTDNYLLYSDSQERYDLTMSVLQEQSQRTLTTMRTIEYLVTDKPPGIPCVNVVYAKDIYIAKVLCS